MIWLAASRNAGRWLATINHGAVFATSEQSTDELCLRLNVEGGGRFVHQDNRILPEKGAGDRDTLSLTSGKIGAALGQSVRMPFGSVAQSSSKPRRRLRPPTIGLNLVLRRERCFLRLSR